MAKAWRDKRSHENAKGAWVGSLSFDATFHFRTNTVLLDYFLCEASGPSSAFRL